MTLKELSQLYWLRREIEADQRRLEELSRIAGSPASPALTGMPRSPSGSERRIERMAAEIADLRDAIAEKQIQCIRERTRLESWINDIPDSLTRQIFRLRFVNGLSWLQVAYAVGGGNTETGVRKRCYRYMKAQETETEKPCTTLST